MCLPFPIYFDTDLMQKKRVSFMRVSGRFQHRPNRITTQKRLTKRGWLVVGMLVSLFAVGLVVQLSGLVLASVSTNASLVIGQPNFTSNTDNNGGVSAKSLYAPTGVAVAPNGEVYVADYGNSRVLHFLAGSTTADRVYGQPDATTNTANTGGINDKTLNFPIGVAVDTNGDLYIADTFNNRVLHYPAGSTTADRVYGQASSFTSSTPNYNGISQNSLFHPYSLVVESNGGLYIADTGNQRILHYPAGSISADRVYGQLNDFSTAVANKGGASSDSLSGVTGLVLDSSGGLYAADATNNRVLHYPAGSTTADRVYGQLNDFTSYAANIITVSRNSLYNPFGVALDSGGELYISDNKNNRILHYPVGSTIADKVYGQGGNFNTNYANNNGGVSASSFLGPASVTTDSANNLYVPDNSNNRLLIFPAILPPASVSVAAGSGQSAPVGSGFTTNLVAMVKDAGGTAVRDIPVVFSAPTAGASGTFLGGSPVFTGTTDSTGQVSSPAFTANTIVGSYIVTATVNGIAQPASFNLTNQAGSQLQFSSPAYTTTEGASGAVVTVNRVGSSSGVVTATLVITDVTTSPNDYQSSAPAGNANLFANEIPSPPPASLTPSGPIAITLNWPDGDSTSRSIIITATNDILSEPTETAILGLTNIQNAAIAGSPITATFAIFDNDPGQIGVISGNNQSRLISSVFTQPLKAQVKTQAGDPVGSVLVTFTLPSTGPSATFAGVQNSFSDLTDASGFVTTTTFTANNLAGSYTISATVGGVASPAVFSLTNLAPCDPLLVTSDKDDGNCGTLRKAVDTANLASPASTTITISLSAGSTISLTTGITLTGNVVITTTAGCASTLNNTIIPPITIKGALNNSGDGLTLLGNNRIYGLWVRGFQGVQIEARRVNHTIMRCVRASKAAG